MGDVLGVARSYAELRKLIAMRRRELRLSQEVVNDLAGLQGGYINKLEVGLRCFGDKSLDAVLGALGLEIAVMRSRAPHGDNNPVERAFARQGLRNICAANGAKGGKACQGRRTDVERKRAASKASRARWKKVRAERVEASAVRKIDEPAMSAKARSALSRAPEKSGASIGDDKIR